MVEKLALSNGIPGINVDLEFHYFVRNPWQWVFRKAWDEYLQVPTNSQVLEQTCRRNLPCTKIILGAGNAKPPTNKRLGPLRPCTLRVEVVQPIRMHSTGCNRVEYSLLYMAQGTSFALDCVSDKDDLVRTLQTCNCDYLAPPSLLIDWDVTEEFLKKEIRLPGLQVDLAQVAVLKTPLGSGGDGVYFVSSIEEIAVLVKENYNRAVKERGFLESIQLSLGRIPSWVLQAEVAPAMLIRGGRKFHLRSYVVIVETENTENKNIPSTETYIYNRHEVRTAFAPIIHTDEKRDRMAHITNGAQGNDTRRSLLQDEEDLIRTGLQEKLELFVANAFHVDLSAAIVSSLLKGKQATTTNVTYCDEMFPKTKVFTFAGVDIMVGADEKLYLLEVNVNPAAPPMHVLDDRFVDHLTGLGADLLELVIDQNICEGRKRSNFILASDILARRNP